MQEKSSSYECFNAHNDIVTVALFAPGTARRTQKLPLRAMAQNAKVSSHKQHVELDQGMSCIA